MTVNLPSDFPEGDVEVIVLPASDEINEEQTASRPRKLTVELLASRLLPPLGVGSVSLTDMDEAILHEALGRGDI